MTQAIEKLLKLKIPHNLKDEELSNIMFECEEIGTFIAGLATKYKSKKPFERRDKEIANNISVSLSNFKKIVNDKQGNDEKLVSNQVIDSLYEILKQLF